MIFGIHGTSVSVSEKINKEGFITSISGMSGPGVYFWRYFNEDCYARYLSFMWWKYSKERGEYNKLGKNTDCCLMAMKLNTTEDKTLDLSHGQIREEVRSLVNKQLKRIKSSGAKITEPEEILVSTLYQLFVEKIENYRGVKFDAIISDISTPKGSPGKIGRYFGNCGEAVVVLNTSSIEIIASDMVTEYEY